MITKLLFQKRFWPLFVTQFLGAFNDNLFKNVLLIAIAFGLFADFSEEKAPFVMAACQGLFILPFFLFSAYAGQLADKCEKGQLIRKIKLAEMVITVIVAFGFYSMSFKVLVFGLFLFGLQSTFFGPLKYSILPQHLKAEELLAGNGFVEMGTFLAILGGTIAGGVLVVWGATGLAVASGLCLLLAVLGYLTSSQIPQAPAAQPDLEMNWHPNQISKIYRYACELPAIHAAIIGISWFWAFGASLLLLIPSLAKIVVGAGEVVVTYFLTLVCVGIGLGSLVCGLFSSKRMGMPLVPIGAIGMIVFTCDLFWVAHQWNILLLDDLLSLTMFLTQASSLRLSFDLLAISISGGLFVVPLYALVQYRAPPQKRSQIIAANNIINSLFMVLTAAGIMVLTYFSVGIGMIFLVLAVVTVVFSGYLYRQLSF